MLKRITPVLYSVAILPGLFSDCTLELKIIHERQSTRYLADALGREIHVGQQQQEYIDRRVRSRYLLENVAKENQDEFRYFNREILIPHGQLLDHRRRRPNEGEISRQNPLFLSVLEHIRKELRSKLQNLEVDGKPLEKRYPFSTSLVLARLPHGLNEYNLLKRVLFVRSSMSAARARVFKEFTELPVDRPLAVLPPEKLEEARHKGTRKALEVSFQQAERAGIRDFRQALHQGVEDFETDYPAMAQALLSHPAVPNEVRAEIHIQMDFERRYGFFPNLLYKLFLRDLYALFLPVQ